VTKWLSDVMTQADVDSAITSTIDSMKKQHEYLDQLQARLDRLGVYRQMLIAEAQMRGKKTKKAADDDRPSENS